MNKLKQAIEWAKALHKGQKRTTGEDYITHPLRVLETLKLKTSDENILIAGILHDVLEDTIANYEDIAERFGFKVANLVEAVSKSRNHSYSCYNKECLMIKFADMLDNASDDPKLNWIKSKCLMINKYGSRRRW